MTVRLTSDPRRARERRRPPPSPSRSRFRAPAGLELLDRQLALPHPVGQVVHDADRRVAKSPARRRSRTPRRSSCRSRRRAGRSAGSRPVSRSAGRWTPSRRRRRASPARRSGSRHRRPAPATPCRTAPRGASAGRRRRTCRRASAMKSSGTEERPDAELTTEAADRAQRKHPVAAGVDEPLHVRRVIDPVRLRVGVPVAGDQHRVTDIQAVDVVAARDAEPAAHLLRGGDRIAPLAEAAVLAR